MSLTPNPAGECKVCRGAFIKSTSTQVVCSVKCARRVPVIERKKDADRREALKTRSEWIAEAQAAVNRYARLRDIRRGRGCITCGATFGSRYGGSFDAGHMLSRGSAPHLRFRLDNIALQCVKDNRYLGGMALQFRAAMVARHGLARVEALESEQGPAKFTVEYLKRLKRVFTKKANRMEKRIAMQG